MMPKDSYPVYIFILLLIIHFCCAVPFLFVPSSRLHKRKEYLIPILFLPLFGPFLAITIEILFLIQKPGTKPVELESPTDENDILWKSFVTSKEDSDAIPLEEAILLNDIHTRRKAVLNTFRDDSFRYLDVLMVARNDEDVDTTHYATIQISKIQRQFQLRLQKLAADFEKRPNDAALLDEYIDLLDTYLQSPLPEKGILRHQRDVYAKLLDQKLALDMEDKETLVRKLRNCTDIGEDYHSAMEIIDLLKSKWPEDEQIWIETLRSIVNWKDAGNMQKTVKALQTQKIRWTRWGREQVSLWVQI